MSNSNIYLGSVAMILANPFRPDPRVLEEAKALAEAGHNVTIWAWDRKKKFPLFEEYNGIRIRRIQTESSYGLGNAQLRRIPLFWWQVFREILKEPPNVVHCHDFDTLPIGYLISRFCKVPVIYDSHEVYVDEISSRVSPLILKLIVNLEDFFLRRVDTLITPGKRYQQKLVERGGKNPVIVGSYKDIDEFHPESEVIKLKREELGVKDHLVISYIGAYYPSRAIFPLLEAIRHDSEVLLITGGNGSDTSKVRRLIEQIPNAVFLGFVEPKDIPLYTAICDVVYYGLYPQFKNNQNSLPNKLFEAMAAGKAIIATKGVGEIAEVVGKERCGVLIDQPTSQEIARAFEKLKDRTFLKELQQNALNAARQKYNWQKAKQVLLGIYKEIIDK